MKTNNLTIIPPEGMEAFLEGNEIIFRPIMKISTYEMILHKLFSKGSEYSVSTNCTSERHAQKLLAINKLMNVAKYLNDSWIPDWDAYYSRKYYIFMNSVNNSICISFNDSYCNCAVYFKSEELAQKAIEILGENTIRLALSSDW